MNDHQLLANLIEQYSRYISFKDENGGEITEQGFLNFYGTTIKDREFPPPELQEAYTHACNGYCKAPWGGV